MCGENLDLDNYNLIISFEDTNCPFEKILKLIRKRLIKPGLLNKKIIIEFSHDQKGNLCYEVFGRSDAPFDLKL